jgi:hypothetical protein
MANEFLASLPPELQGDPSLQTFADPATLAKAFVETKSLVGRSIRVPDKDASPESRKEFLEKLQGSAPELLYLPEDPAKRGEVEPHVWSKLGRPKDAEGYKLEALKADVPLPDEEVKELRSKAWKLGLTQAQFKAEYEERAAARASMATALQNEQAGLRRDWGVAYEERMQAARIAADKTGAPESLRRQLASGQVSAEVARWLAGLGKSLGVEASPVSGQRDGAPSRLSPAEAKAARSELRAQKEFWDRSINPGRTEYLIQRDLELAAMEYPPG